MSVIFTGTNQGKFTSTGASQTLNIRSGVDWIKVLNYTDNTQYFWQIGMAAGVGKITAANGTTASLGAGLGFYPIDTSLNVPGASVVLTAISGAAIPVVSTGNTGGLANGDIVRLYNVTGGVQLNSIDFTIGAINANVSFTLAYMSQIVAANAGTFRRIPYNPIFYPRNRYIVSISQAVEAVVVLTVTHGYKVGQVVSFVVPSVGGSAASYGMTEINGLQGTILAIDTATNSITVDIDTTAFTAFAFPTTAQAAAGFTQAQVVPVGMNTAEGLDSGVDILSDATINTGLIGIQLVGGANSPAGAVNDVIYWTSGNSFSINN
ncbi:hypothetical protein UFOVP1478_9 [uncultured Caudovirales phage]|uniref:Uncharacterized protein n=1 Tax=uncultured Caudovirales phage TaxID=2100421 RepID=A0A6J5QIT2_9CAUD|nr:hypothetical protein UFOVP1112_12 [uncultured Caudovirales phage]CAB4204109.1 hypothetical protein UFOVP1385_33 [uncultured Caudovirales phage]CAB4215258.1 hypothetical protein UFOVP1478_9 [uncultured Caudovirales phage]